MAKIDLGKVVKTDEEITALIDQYPVATPEKKGLMSAAMVEKLAGIDVGVIGKNKVSPMVDSANARVLNLTLYGKSTQEQAPTLEAPQEIKSSGDSGSLVIKTVGKNLLNPTLQTTTVNGITCTSNGDGTYTLDGTASSSANITLMSLSSFDVFDRLKLVGCPPSGNGATYYMALATNGSWVGAGEYGAGRYVNKGSALGNLNCVVKEGVTVSNLIFKPMLTTVLDATYDDFVPYEETAVTIATPQGLNGIPVSSNGNYTDASGQQWMCDEIVKYPDGTGKRVQRIGIIASYNGESVSTEYLSTTGQLTAGVKVLYVLATPIETPLTADEVAEFEKLRTFDPITHFFVDSNFEMCYYINTEIGQAIADVDTRASTGQVKIVYMSQEPETVPEGTIVAVYE